MGFEFGGEKRFRRRAVILNEGKDLAPPAQGWIRPPRGDERCAPSFRRRGCRPRQPEPPLPKGGCPSAHTGAGGIRLSRFASLWRGIPATTFALAKKTIGRIRTGVAANSPKACAAFCLCRRDVREAVPYEEIRISALSGSWRMTAAVKRRISSRLHEKGHIFARQEP